MSLFANMSRKSARMAPAVLGVHVLMQTFHCYNTAVVNAMYMLVRREKKTNQTRMYNLTKCVKNYYIFNPQKVIFLGPLYRLNALCELFISIL